MLLYEASYKQGYNNKIRALDTSTNCSVSIDIPNTYEYYVPSAIGTYKSISNKYLRLEKRFGKYADTVDQYGVFNAVDRYIRDNFWKKAYNENPRIWYIDIETRVTRGEFPTPSKALEEITLMQIFDSKLNRMIIFGVKDFKMEDNYNLEFEVKYFKCLNEYEILLRYFQLFEKLNPLIIYAWNGDGFDFPYIFNRMSRIGMDTSKLSNYGEVKLKSEKNEKTSRITYSLSAAGHYYFDLMEVYKNFVLTNRSSYSLDNISKIELGDEKIKHDEFVDFDSFYTGENYNIANTPYEDKVREEIRQLKIVEKSCNSIEEFGTKYPNEKKRLDDLISFQFVYYGAKDVYLLKKLDSKLNFTNIIVSIGKEMGCNLKETMTTIRPWTTMMKNIYYSLNLVVDPVTTHDGTAIVGGYVREPQSGVHEWMLSEDVNSMYPLLSMKGFNMSPETFIKKSDLPQDLKEHVLKYYNDQDEDKILALPEDVKNETRRLLKKYNYSLSINGAVFDNSLIGVVPQTVSEIYFGRKADKKKMLQYEQQSEVIKDIIKNKQNKEF